MPPRFDDLMRIRIARAPDRLAWAIGSEVSLPAAFVSPASVSDAGVDLTPLSPPPRDAAQMLRMRAAFTEAPLSSRLPFSYQLVPAWMRAQIARVTGRRIAARSDEWARFPGWPIDLSADVLSDWADVGSRPTTARAPVLLTHDIDSAEGLRNLVTRFLPLAEAVGARATSYVVPCAWTLNRQLLREIVDRGHAIGVHGYDHANRTPFAADSERRRRLTEGRAALSAYSPTGYRAPSLLRTPALLADLADYYAYDASIPTAGGPFPVPNQGCATARPFRIGRTLEIPLSMPRDGSLRFLGYPPDEIGALWERTAGHIATARGTVVLLTHCEDRFSGAPEMLRVYRRFLEFVAESPRFRWSTPDEVARASA